MEPPPPQPQEPAAKPHAIVTDRSRYQLTDGPFGPETTVDTTFTAPADRSVYLIHCNGGLSVGLQRRVGEQWVNAWIAEVNGCFSEPIVVAAGRTHSTPMRVVSRGDAPDASQRTGTRIESGTYRAVWFGVLTSFDPARPRQHDELPLEQRVSAPFVIEARSR